MSFFAWIILLLILYFLYYVFCVVKVPEFYCGPADFRRFLSTNCLVISSKYWPAVWCYHAYPLTHFSNSFRMKLRKHKYQREILPTIDGGQFPIEWYDPEGQGLEAISKGNSKPICFFVPALGDTAHSSSFRTMVPIAYKAGYQPVVLNYRGMTSVPLLNPIMYSAAFISDIKEALEHIKEENPNSLIVGTGTSMGGNLLAGYLVATGADSLLDAAFFVSVLWDCIRGTKNLEEGWLNPKISQQLCKMLVRLVRRHQHIFEKYPEFVASDLEKVKTIRDFDEHFTRKMFLFESCDDYYRAASHHDKMHLIKVPTLTIQAADDMMALRKDLPVEAVRRSGHVAMVITSRGGHLGFMDGWNGFFSNRTYVSDRLFDQYLRALLTLKENPRNVFKGPQIG